MDAQVVADRYTGLKECIEIRPHRSLSRSMMWSIFVAYAIVIGTIAVGFAVAGAWLVAPFAGLELLVIGFVVGFLVKRADDCELIVLDERQVSVIKYVGGKEARMDFQRGWLQVELQPARDLRSTRLFVGSHGCYVEIAAAINNDDKIRLAEQIRNKLIIN